MSRTVRGLAAVLVIIIVFGGYFTYRILFASPNVPPPPPKPEVAAKPAAKPAPVVTPAAAPAKPAAVVSALAQPEPAVQKLDAPRGEVPKTDIPSPAPAKTPVASASAAAKPAQSGPPSPSAAFKAFIETMKINGVFHGQPARALINGTTYTQGSVVDAGLGVKFERDDADKHVLVFRDGQGVVIERQY